MVTDPARVDGLTLSAQFCGGAVVYLNGREVGRAHVADGPIGRDTLADRYPREAFVNENGQVLAPDGVRLMGLKNGIISPDWTAKAPPDSARRAGLRRRAIDGMPIPSEFLRKGINVLAVEIIRAPYDDVVEELKNAVPANLSIFAYHIWCTTCEIDALQMRARRADGLTPNAARPPGLQVWNSDPMASDFHLECGDPCESLRPITLVGIRNGRFSGKVILGHTEPIRGLQAVASDLKADGAITIPASHVRVRYGIPCGEEKIRETLRHAPDPYPRPQVQLGGIADVPMAEYPVLTTAAGWDYKTPPGQPVPVFGAVVPLWVTVRVPADASPGTYTGRVTVSMLNEEPVEVPVRLKVEGWTLPDPQDYTTWVDLIQTPDTLALEYGLDLWSEAHWKMIARSFRLMGEVGNGTLYIPLLAHTNLGNDESMVRWRDKGDDQYDYDFSIMDRYLDVAEKNMGKPAVIILSVWELYLLPKDTSQADSGASRTDKKMAINVENHKGQIGLGPRVPFVDAETGKVRNAFLRRYGEAGSKAMWSSLLLQIQERLRKRGLDEAIMFGLLSDAWASKEEVQFFEDILPDTAWVVQSHGGFPEGRLLHGLARVGYQARTWNTSFADGVRSPYNLSRQNTRLFRDADSNGGRMYGWNQSGLIALFHRARYMTISPASRWRFFAETNTTGAQRGVGRTGADFWPAIKDKRGRRTGYAHDRYPESHWRNLCIWNYVLAPGPTGPCATNRFEAFREGVQACEARIFIERALINPEMRKDIGEELAGRCRAMLDERLALMWKSMSNLQMHGSGADSGAQYATGWRWAPGICGHVCFVGSGWQERSEKLYALAAEVDRKLGITRTAP